MKAIPKEAHSMLAILPAEFVSDGCSGAPDVFFGVDVTWACMIHDFFIVSVAGLQDL
jgi:hypothetical protein